MSCRGRLLAGRDTIRRQNHALTHRLTRQLAGNGIGVKRRRYLHTPAFRPGKEELRQVAVKQAGEGGLSARLVDDYEQELRELAEIQKEELAVETETIRRHAEEDL